MRQYFAPSAVFFVPFFVASLSLTSTVGAQTTPFATVNGYVTDMSLDGSGNLIYCTEQREVGKITIPAGNATILATGTSGPLPNALRGIAKTPAGDIALVDAVGDIYKLPSGSAPAVKVYSDLYMIADPTDLIVDAAGNYVVVSQTPSSGFKAINWMSSDGSRWAYYLIKHQPIGLAFDPITNNLLITDTANGGTLRMVDTADQSHPTSPLDTVSFFGFNQSTNDGDMAVEGNGDILLIGNGKLYRYSRSGGSSTILVSGLGASHGLMIAASSANVTSGTGYSAFIATGATGGPTTIVEYPNVIGPSTLQSPSLGTVPNKGIQLPTLYGMNVFEMTADENFDLLIGGDLWGTIPAVKRVNLSSLTVTTVANNTNGISSRIEGISIASDRTIYALTTNGVIHKIVESPYSVSTVFSDPSDVVAIGEDMALDRSGAMYIAARQGYGSGYITKVENGVHTIMASMSEPRGLTADPFTAKILYTDWVNVGFQGLVGTFNPNNNTLSPIANFEGMNYSNAGVWADGDTAVDVEGNIYTCSEDDFSLYKFNRSTGKLVRIGSGYLNHPSGVAIARSTASSGSTTGWSLYVSEYNYIYEIPSVAAPAARLVDTAAPPVGKVVCSIPPSSGVARSMVADPTGNGLYISTMAGTLEHIATNGTRVIVADGSKGLSGDLTGLAVNSAGHIFVANRIGRIWDVDPSANYAATMIFTNPGPQLADLRSIAIDGLDRIIIFDRPTSATPNAAKMYRLDSGLLTLLEITNRGYRGAIDPLSGDVFIPEMGNAVDGGGEILRVNEFGPVATAGHYRGSSFFTLKTGTLDGGIAFKSDGSFYIPITTDGRIYYVDRATGNRSVVSGNYDRPVACAIAPGSVGTAGAQGMSLFILDRASIFEVGISGFAASAPPSSNPQLDNGADLRVTGMMNLGSATDLQIQSPADANRLYLVVASLSGKTPGLVFSQVFDPVDTRVLPNNPDDIWMFVNDPNYLPDFIGFLDGNGASPSTMQLLMPNDPNLILNQFLDFAWITLEPTALSGIASVGGTAQIYLGY